MLTEEQKQQLRGLMPSSNNNSISQIPNSSYLEQRRQSVLGQNVQPEQQNTGLFSDLKSRFSNIKNIFGQTFRNEITPVETGLQSVGQVAGGATDVIGAGFRKLGDFLSFATPDAIEQPIVSSIKSNFEQALQKSDIPGLLESYSNWKEENPRAAANLEATVNIASILPEGKIAQELTQQAVKFSERLVPRVVRNATNDLLEITEKRIAKSEIDDALDVVKPYLSKKDKINALQSGRGEAGFLGNIKVNPSRYDEEVAASVAGVVKKNKNNATNINLIRDEIAKIGEKVEEGLKNNNTIFNEKQLKSFINKYKQESSVIFAGDKALENSYNAVIDEYFKILNKYPKTLTGALKARKEFDNVIQNKFPNIFKQFGGDNIRANAVQDTRTAINDYIASRLPTGNQYKELLRQQSNMYRAITNISENSIKLIDENLAKRAIGALRKNVLVQGLTGGILTAAALGNVISNPFVLGSLLAGGVVTIGKSTITSSILRNTLKNALNIAKNKSLPLSDIQALTGLIKAIETSEQEQSQE